ncbi:glycerol-3-phosphate 1-O-acyltransferase PlsY [Anaerostipes sp.]|uniref:glycerol-3-phosphate 1-O-acyltransferase PlsY n=1 Tax=Anaerostipes sp. TaxID=1872530 RepID=UPI003FED805B
MMLCVVVCMIVGYLFGCFQTGYFVGRINKIDIRDYGSGNSGTTNTLRTLGKTAAIITFLGDALKGLIAVNLARYVIIPAFGVKSQAVLWLLTGFAVVLGHNFPFFLKFKGGKGIATTGGVIFAFHWQLGLLCGLVFLVVTALTKYVSLGSICMVLIIPFILYFSEPNNWPLIFVGCIFTAMAIWRHRANIERLLHGTENKLGQKVKR